jgi:DNA replication protein DnaC
LVAAAYERRSLAVASHWPFEQWGRFLPEHTTAASILDRLLHHASVVITNGTQSCSWPSCWLRRRASPGCMCILITVVDDGGRLFGVS